MTLALWLVWLALNPSILTDWPPLPAPDPSVSELSRFPPPWLVDVEVAGLRTRIEWVESQAQLFPYQKRQWAAVRSALDERLSVWSTLQEAQREAGGRYHHDDGGTNEDCCRRLLGDLRRALGAERWRMGLMVPAEDVRLGP